MTNKSLRNSSVVKLLKILESVAEHEGGLGITELANKLDINKSTVYRFAATLEEEGYLKKNQSTQQYQFGLGMFELASKVVNQKNWISDIHPYLVDLKDRVQETVHLGVEDDSEVVYIDKVDCDRSVRMYSKVGRRSPLYCTGIGKAILAHLPEEQSELIFQKLKFHPYTDHTITNLDDLRMELKKIRAQGYSFDLEEHELGVKCTAAPIFNFKGSVIGAISIAGPSSRIDKLSLFDLAVEIKDTAQLISRRLGSL
jgi:DNA-binding IclR family transcriptional regulator